MEEIIKEDDTLLKMTLEDAIEIYSGNGKYEIADTSYDDPYPGTVNIIFEYNKKYWWIIAQKQEQEERIYFLNPLSGEKSYYNNIFALSVEKDEDFDKLW